MCIEALRCRLYVISMCARATISSNTLSRGVLRLSLQLLVAVQELSHCRYNVYQSLLGYIDSSSKLLICGIMGFINLTGLWHCLRIRLIQLQTYVSKGLTATDVAQPKCGGGMSRARGTDALNAICDINILLELMY